jgi:hypothetical protein
VNHRCFDQAKLEGCPFFTFPIKKITGMHRV